VSNAVGGIGRDEFLDTPKGSTRGEAGGEWVGVVVMLAKEASCCSCANSIACMGLDRPGPARHASRFRRDISKSNDR
jgi:hypothetical protein